MVTTQFPHSWSGVPRGPYPTKAEKDLVFCLFLLKLAGFRLLNKFCKGRSKMLLAAEQTPLAERLKELLGDFPRFFKEAGGNVTVAAALQLLSLERTVMATSEKRTDLI